METIMGEKQTGNDGDNRTDEEIIAEKLRQADLEQGGGKGGESGGKEGYSEDGGGKGDDAPQKG
jgi:hypothetical protein